MCSVRRMMSICLILRVLLLPVGCHVGSYPGRAAYLSRSAPTIPKNFGFVDKIFEFFDFFGIFQHFSGFFGFFGSFRIFLIFQNFFDFSGFFRIFQDFLDFSWFFYFSWFFGFFGFLNVDTLIIQYNAAIRKEGGSPRQLRSLVLVGGTSIQGLPRISPSKRALGSFVDWVLRWIFVNIPSWWWLSQQMCSVRRMMSICLILRVLLLPVGCHVGSYPGRAAYLSRSAPTIPPPSMLLPGVSLLLSTETNWLQITKPNNSDVKLWRETICSAWGARVPRLQGSKVHGHAAVWPQFNAPSRGARKCTAQNCAVTKVIKW